MFNSNLSKASVYGHNKNDSLQSKQTQDLQISATAHVYSNGFNISCFGKKDGSIDLTVSGGTSPYYYKWSTGESTRLDIIMLKFGMMKTIM